MFFCLSLRNVMGETWFFWWRFLWYLSIYYVFLLFIFFFIITKYLLFNSLCFPFLCFLFFDFRLSKIFLKISNSFGTYGWDHLCFTVRNFVELPFKKLIVTWNFVVVLVRNTVAFSLAAIAHWDWPDHWPQLFDILMQVWILSIRSSTTILEIYL